MKKILYVTTISLIMLSCGSISGGSNEFPSYSSDALSNSSPTDTTQSNTEEQNSNTSPTTTTTTTATTSTQTSSTPTFGYSDQQFLLYLFRNEYLWYDKINTNIDVAGFTNPNDMIDALRYQTYDVWSYAETYEEYENFANQNATGSFGFWYDYETFQIMNVIIGSPAQDAGLKRGDILTHINGSPISLYGLYEARMKLNVKALFTVKRGESSMIIEMAPSSYSYEVTQYSIITTASNKKVGLLIYDQFTSSSTEEYDKEPTAQSHLPK